MAPSCPEAPIGYGHFAAAANVRKKWSLAMVDGSVARIVETRIVETRGATLAESSMAVGREGLRISAIRPGKLFPSAFVHPIAHIQVSPLSGMVKRVLF